MIKNIKKHIISIKNLLYSIVLIVCISIIIQGLLIYLTVKKIVTARAENEIIGISSHLSYELTERIENDINILKSISQTIQTSTNINDSLSEQHKVLNQFEEIFIVNENGRVSNISPYSNKQNNINILQFNYIQYVLKEKKPYISSPLKDFSGNDVIRLAVPILINVGGQKWEFIGIMCGSISLENLFTPINDSKIFANQNSTKFAMVIDENGLLLNFPDKKRVLKSKLSDLQGNTLEAKNFQKLVLSNSHGTLRYTIQNIDSIISYHKVENKNWTVIISIPVQDILSDVYLHRNKIILLTSIILFITIFIILIINKKTDMLRKNIEEKSIKIRSILKSIPQGLLTFSKGLIIDQEYSEYLKNIYKVDDNHKISGQRIFDFIFQHTSIS